MNKRLSQAEIDVRMRGFALRTSVAAAIEWLDQQLAPLAPEKVELVEAAGRVLPADVYSDVDVPGFDRAMMDGFALDARSVEGAGPYNRLVLSVVGESYPGRPFSGCVETGQAVRIMTGAPMPGGTNAVLPAELAESQGERVWASGDVSPGKNIGRRGEDVVSGGLLLRAGRRLRPQDLGVLSSVGIGCVAVTRRPQVSIVLTGDELLEAGTRPRDFNIADANGPMLAALVERDGGQIVGQRLVPDVRDRIAEALLQPADVVLVSGGSSVGQEDHVPLLVSELGELTVHGVAMRPSSPCGMGRINTGLVFLLPGNPVSCLCAYDFFAGRAIRALGGRDKAWPYRQRKGKLGRKISSVIGRVDYARVMFVDGAIEPVAISGASILTSTTKADGFLIIPEGSEGYAAGTEIDVYLYD